MSVPWTPSHGCSAYPPVVMRDEISRIMALDGMAKPNPCEFSIMAVVMPTTWPSPFSSGPPELPGLMGASNWIMLAIA